MTVHKRFLEMEIEADFFDKVIADDIYVWERIRHKVYRKINKHLGNEQQRHTVPNTYTDDLKKAWQLSKNLLYKNPFLSSNADVLFYGHRRRKKLEDGLWWDPYCDIVIDELNQDYLLIEAPYLTKHKKPSKTNNIRHLDLITYSDGVYEKLKLYPELSSKDKKTISEIENEIQSKFQIRINIERTIKREVIKRNVRLPMYKKLLDRVNPEIAVIVVSYGKEPFIEACNNKQIPVVEFQHGVIDERHLGYHYPGERVKRQFPDYLFTFGKHWNNCVDYPIKSERVFSVGYPFLEQRYQKYKQIDEKDQILFISQGNIGDKLSEFALSVDQHPRINHDIVYKLHPGEYDRWKKEYPWLTNVDFRIIDGSEPPLYELFATSSVQIGVGSTAIYEGLYFNLETYIYDCIDSSVLKSLVEEDTATTISSADELATLIGTRETKFDRKYYFKPNSTKNICGKLRHLATK